MSVFSWWRDRQRRKMLFERASAAEERDIEGLGVVHIRPLNVSERLALSQEMAGEGDKLTIYIWLISISVKEFSGLSVKTLGKKLPRMAVIKALVEAIFDVSGLTASSQAANEKKSPPTPN